MSSFHKSFHFRVSLQYNIESRLSGLNQVQRSNIYIYIQEGLFSMPVCDVFMRESTKFYFIFLFILVCVLLDKSNSFA